MEDEPRYLEAYPILAMAEVMGKRWRGTWDVVWRNEFHEVRGEGVFIWREHTAEFLYEVLPIGMRRSAQGRKLVMVQPKMYGSHSVRPSCLCRSCGVYVSRMFLKLEEWLCKECHGLRNRSTFMTSVERWSAELSQLRYHVGRGRPFGMRNDKYLKMRDRMQDLELKLGGERRPLRNEPSGLIYADWSFRSLEEPTDGLRGLSVTRRSQMLAQR